MLVQILIMLDASHVSPSLSHHYWIGIWAASNTLNLGRKTIHYGGGGNNKSHFPSVSMIAPKLLLPTPCGVATERWFSSAGVQCLLRQLQQSLTWLSGNADFSRDLTTPIQVRWLPRLLNLVLIPVMKMSMANSEFKLSALNCLIVNFVHKLLHFF